jgi:tetratricopeptide (TPR) repeat protein
MDAERWPLVKDRFSEALNLPLAERRRFLRHLDEATRSEVEALLGAAEPASGPLDLPFDLSLLGIELPGAAPASESGAAQLQAGTRVGPYVIEEKIGQGGMGDVYRARRADGLFERVVALKVVRADTETVLARFAAERRILGTLEHPGIARLIAAGADAEGPTAGRPWLALEYVDGVPLTEDVRDLGLRERLRLVAEVAEAVHHAHRRLVVHRDLKPSNVLVTESGEVKLLDFGIARLLDERADEAAPLTRPEWRVLTPEYAAPEQLRGEPATTATDVYALGVLLYELLVGRRSDADPTPPSAVVTPDAADVRATTPERLRRSLRGDLDTLALAALHPDPARRYASAEALLDDLRRLHTGLPLRARPDSRRYRLGKFVERHRVGVAISAVGLLLLVGFFAMLFAQQRATARERDRAEHALAQKEEVVVLLTELLGEADPRTAQGDTLTAYELLARAEARVAGEDYASDVRAHLLHALGNVYLSMAEHDRAEPLLTEALALRRSLGPEAHADVASTLELLGRLARDRGEMDEAVALHAEALGLRRALHADPHSALGQTLNELAVSYQRQGEFETSEAHFREAIATYRASGAASDPRLAETLSNLAILHYEADELGEAEALLREAVSMLRTHYGNRHPHVAYALSSLGSVVQYAGRLDEAEPIFLDALAIHRRAYGEVHPNVSLVLNNLATLYDDRGDDDRADSLYRRAIRSDSLRLGARHPDLAIPMHNHGLMLLETGRAEAAEARLREAYAILHEALGADHLHTLIFASTLGLGLADAGQPSQGEALLRSALPALEAELGADHWRVAIARRNLGACLTALGAYEEAETHLRHSLAVLTETRGPESSVVQEAQRRLAALYVATGRPEEAARYRALDAS